jgi:hypothetical protein
MAWGTVTIRRIQLLPRLVLLTRAPDCTTPEGLRENGKLRRPFSCNPEYYLVSKYRLLGGLTVLDGKNTMRRIL